MKFGRSVVRNAEPLLSAEVRNEILPNQIVTLAYLSEHIGASHVSERLAASLCAETEASVILVRFAPQETSDRLDAADRPEIFLNGEFHLPPVIKRTEAGFHSLTLGVRSDPPSPEGVASLIEQLSGHFRYVLLETQVVEQPAPWILNLLERSSLGYLFLKPSTETVRHLETVMREAQPLSHRHGVRLKPIACLADGEEMDGFDLLVQRVAGPVHFYVRGCPAREGAGETGLPMRARSLFRADVRRLAREIGRRLVGLALSSGAAKGFAHIGVIQVLEENGIDVDVIAGASMGAYVGSLWAYGCDGRELERLARECEGRWKLWSLIDPAFPPRRGFLRGFAVKKRLMRSLGHARFADLVRPFRVVATNLATLERVVLSGGEVAAAVHASIAVPGICVPVSLNGETLSDGGIVDPLPVDILREMGVTKVIAVNVIPTPDRIRYGIEAQIELARHDETKSRKRLHKLLPLDQQMNYFARGNLLDILMRSVHGAQIRMAEAACPNADIVLRPDIYDDCWLDYRNPGKFIALGREAAERHLDEIRSLVSGKEEVHELPAPESMAAFI